MTSRNGEYASVQSAQSNGDWRRLILPLILSAAAAVLGYQAHSLDTRLAANETSVVVNSQRLVSLEVRMTEREKKLDEISIELRRANSLLALLAAKAGVDPR